jgi:hypothetical protein
VAVSFSRRTVFPAIASQNKTTGRKLTHQHGARKLLKGFKFLLLEAV